MFSYDKIWVLWALIVSSFYLFVFSVVFACVCVVREGSKVPGGWAKALKGGARKVGGPNPKTVGRRGGERGPKGRGLKVGVPKGGSPKFRAFFLSPAANFVLSCLFGGPLMELWPQFKERRESGGGAKATAHHGRCFSGGRFRRDNFDKATVFFHFGQLCLGQFDSGQFLVCSKLDVNIARTTTTF